MSEEINFFAKTNFRDKEQPFGIKTDDRRRHFYTLGKTGMGKTSMIQNMAIQDIRNGKGVAVVDPHGEFAEECLKAVPKERINDVIYFNPADLDFPIALNVMEKVDSEYRHLVSSGLIGIFKKLWVDSWGPRLEYILRNAILALLAHPSSTLLGINRLLVDKQYREEVLSYVDDPVVSSFWVDEFSRYGDRLLTEAISPIQNKVGQFLSSGLIRNIIGQVQSSFSVREVMDKNKILIMNLSKGRIGEDNSALLGAMMITKIQLAAMSRVDMPEEQRSDFYLYVDEFQNFATESFVSILSEARKYRLNLILAHQFLAQLDETVKSAVLGNVGTMVAFRLGAMDAEILEKEFEPIFYSNDLVNLDKYNIYLKLMIDGVTTKPFSAKTLFPIDIQNTIVNRDKVIESSRQQYAHHREEVERKILEWSGMKSVVTVNNIKNLVQREIKKQNTEKSNSLKMQSETQEAVVENDVFYDDEHKLNQRVEQNKQIDEMAIMGIGIDEGAIVEKKKKERVEKSDVDEDSQFVKIKSSKKDNNSIVDDSEKKNEVKTIVNCSACGIETEVNFEPDGIRPVFCHECLKEYRRQQAKLQNEQVNKHKKSKKSKGDLSPLKEVLKNQKGGAHKAINKKRKKDKDIYRKIDSQNIKKLIREAIDERK